ncbi:hypothetical protein LguiB_020528 [Lonicera macranthoides]
MCVLQKSESQRNGKQELLKAFERLGKVLPEEDIHQLVGSMVQKNGADMYVSDYSSFVVNRAEREVKRENKLLVKEFEKNQREVEKEKKKNGSGTSEGKIPSCVVESVVVGEIFILKSSYQFCRKNRQSDCKMRQREQNPQDKEEAALRKQLALQRQASLMERFHKRSKNSSSASHNDQKKGIKIEDMWKMHSISWHNLGRSIRSNWKQHLGDRQKPKTEPVRGT